MTSLKDRQRAAARARLEREMAARQQQVQERRRRQFMAGGAAVAVLVVIGLVALIVTTVGGGNSKKHPVAAATLAAPVKCVWKPNPDPSASPAQPKNPNLKNTGLPPASGAPQSGTRDMVLNTSQGNITITLNLAKAPCSAESFAYLASKKFFDNTSCNRLTNADVYILQCGDPTGTGSGGPSYTFAHENLPTDQRPDYPAGVVAMAIPSTVDSNGQQTPASDSNGSQFFIVYKDTPVSASGDSNLPPAFTVIGTVTSGLDVVQKVADGGIIPRDPKNPSDGKPKLPVTITTLTVGPVKSS